MGSLQLVVGNGNRPLGEAVRQELGLEPRTDLIGRFDDGEVRVELDNVRDADLFVFQTTQPPAEHIIELLLIIDAVKRSGAKSITAVLPYFGYARQDRKDKPRVPISAKRIARAIEDAGANRVVLLDIHSGQEQGFFEIPVDHLYARPVLVDWLKDRVGKFVLCAPDANAMKLARSYATRLNVPTAYADKVRIGPDLVESITIVGDVKDKDAVIIDDLVGTGSTLCLAAEALRDQGAKSVMGVAVHAVLSGEAARNIASGPIDSLIVTNTLPISREKVADLRDKLEVVDVAPLLAKVITRIHSGQSVSSLIE